MIFCLSFGLSMDYESLLLFRVQLFRIQRIRGRWPAGRQDDRRRPVWCGARRFDTDPRIPGAGVHEHRRTLESVSRQAPIEAACAAVAN